MAVAVEPGQLISHFEVLEFIGHGLLGPVYKVRNSSTGHSCALKFIDLERQGIPEDEVPAIKEHVRQVVGKLEQLSHPAIVELYDVGETDDYFFISRQYLQGQTLRQRLEADGPMPPGQAVAIVLALTQGLRYVWEQVQVVHRYLRTDNIIMAGHHEARMVDFGIDLPFHDERFLPLSPLAAQTDVTGLCYLAPELHVGVKEIDFRSDVFSLGVVFCELVTGQAPFTGDNVVDVFKAKRHGVPFSIPELAPDLPAELVTAIESMVACRREQRPDSYAEITDLLRDGLASMGEDEVSEPAARVTTPDPPLVRPVSKKSLKPKQIVVGEDGQVRTETVALDIPAPRSVLSQGADNAYVQELRTDTVLLPIGNEPVSRRPVPLGQAGDDLTKTVRRLSLRRPGEAPQATLRPLGQRPGAYGGQNQPEVPRPETAEELPADDATEAPEASALPASTASAPVPPRASPQLPTVPAASPAPATHTRILDATSSAVIMTSTSAIRLPADIAGLLKKLTPGASFKHYRIDSLIGSGPDNAVFRVEHVETEEPLALKFVHFDGDRERLAAYQEDIPCLQQRSIAGVCECLYTEPWLVIASELLLVPTGESFDLYKFHEHYATAGWLDEAWVQNAAQLLLEALHYAHQRGLVHGDLRPENVLFKCVASTDQSWQMRMKICDFGLTSLLGRQTDLQRRGHAFLAPELIAGGEATIAADLYMAGRLIYYCLTGSLLYEAGDRPSRQRPDIDEGWDPVLCKVLRDNPERRFPSAEEMAFYIETFEI